MHLHEKLCSNLLRRPIFLRLSPSKTKHLQSGAVSKMNMASRLTLNTFESADFVSLRMDQKTTMNDHINKFNDHL